MSEEHRAKIGEDVAAILIGLQTREAMPLKNEVDEDARDAADRALILRAGGLFTRFLIDVNRIADAAEVQAAPQSNEGRQFWDDLAADVKRIAKAAETVAAPPASALHDPDTSFIRNAGGEVRSAPIEADKGDGS